MLPNLIFFLLFSTQVWALTPPIEINEKFVEKVLRESYDDKTIVVMNIITEPAAKKGMNFATDVRRVGVRFSKNNGIEVENTSLIIKQALFNEGDNGSFNTEISMMLEVLKKMNQSLQSESLPTPRLFSYQRKFPSLIVMEDLKPLGYQVKNQQDGLQLDYKHSLLAIDAIAKFHAASVSVIENNPLLITQWRRGIDDSLPANYLREKVQALAGLMRNWDEETARYADEVSEFGKNIFNLTYRHFQPKENGFNVLAHGDYTSRNMLFKYNNTSYPVDFMMVDFQFCQFTSPVVDLWYFFSTSIVDRVNIKHVFLLLERYHRTLQSTMKTMNTRTKVISLRQLESDMMESIVLYFYWTVISLPWNLIKEDEIKPLEEFFPYIQKHPEVFYNLKFQRSFKKRFYLFIIVRLFKL